MDDPASRPGMLARAKRILDAFDDDATLLSQLELVRRTGLPQSSLQRIVAEMTELGFLDRRSRDGYAIGTALWERGTLSPVDFRLRETALPHLIRLYEDSGENVHLGVLAGGSPETAEALYVARIAGPRSVPTMSRAGGRHTLHATGVGKALLSTRDPEWLERFLAAPLERETSRTITDPQALRRDIALAAERGYALTSEEMSLGSWSIGMALPPVPGLPPAAVGLVARLDRRHVERAEAQLRTATTAIAADAARA